jgi:hypothetical protein
MPAVLELMKRGADGAPGGGAIGVSGAGNGESGAAGGAGGVGGGVLRPETVTTRVAPLDEAPAVLREHIRDPRSVKTVLVA